MCIDSSVSVLLQTNPDCNQSFLECIRILERRLIDPLLHDPPELADDQIEVIGLLGGPQIRRDKIWGFALQQFDRFARRRAGALSC